MAPRIFMILLRVKKNQSLSLSPLSLGSPFVQGGGITKFVSSIPIAMGLICSHSEKGIK